MKRRRRILFSLLFSLLPVGAEAAVGVIERVSVASNGTEAISSGIGFGPFGSEHPALSADGRFVAFESEAINLVAGDTNGRMDTFVRDTCIGVQSGCVPSTIRVSVANDGSEGNDDSFAPSISGDGRFVAFESFANNLVFGDFNSRSDTFVRDTCSGAPSGCVPSTIRVSVADDGSEGNHYSYAPSISGDGRFVAFESNADNLTVGDTNGRMDTFVRDTCSGAPSGCVPSTVRVSVANDGSEGNGNSNAPSISADGRFVAFYSYASNLVIGDGNAFDDYFVRDTCFGAPSGCVPGTIRVSVASDGTEGINNSGGNPAPISADGRFVAFGSWASNLVAGDTNIAKDIFVRDTCFGAPSGCVPSTVLASVASDGTQGGSSSLLPTLSADGRFVAFYSYASSLVIGDTNGVVDVFVRDTCIGVVSGCVPSTVRVSVTNGGTEGNADTSTSFGPPLSADGRYVAFESNASNLVAGDTNAVKDVFLAGSGSDSLPPNLGATGIVNAASYQSPGAVTPGALVALFGTDLANTTQLAGSVPLPTTLGGATVTIGGVVARLVYASPTQINLQIPWEVTGMSNPTLLVQTGTTSAPVNLSVLGAQPGIFTTNQSGSGQGAILIANSSSLAAPVGAFPGSQPVQRGSYIEIFCTGLGPVNNPPASGAATPDASSTLVFPPTVTIGGVEAPVSFAGLAPGFVALYQVNVQVPQNTPVGDTVPLVLFAGVNANTVILAVQ